MLSVSEVVSDGNLTVVNRLNLGNNDELTIQEDTIKGLTSASGRHKNQRKEAVTNESWNFQLN